MASYPLLGSAFAPPPPMIRKYADSPWNIGLRAGTVVASLARHTLEVFSIVFSPESALAAAGSKDHSIRVQWNSQAETLSALTRGTQIGFGLWCSGLTDVLYDNTAHVFEVAVERAPYNYFLRNLCEV